MMAQTAPLQVTTPNETDVMVVREFDAPRDLVFKAFTTPELLMRWLGKEKYPMIECEVDLHAGGRYLYVWRVKTSRLTSTGVFREVATPERFVSTERMGMDDEWYPGEALNTHSFVERKGKTTVTMTMRYESKEIRDMALASGMAEGIAESFHRLDALLSTSSHIR